MAADTLPVARGVLQTQRRSLVGWSIAMAAVSALYTASYTSVGGGEEMEALLESMPDGLVQALGYDAIGTAAGYLQSTVYGIIGPVLLLVFGIATGARLFAGQEEDGTLELELASPVSRRRIFAERLLTLWTNLLLLVVVLSLVALLVTAALRMDVGLSAILAGSLPLLLLGLGFGTLALAVGAVTGRRVVALGVAAALAVLAYMLNAIGPATGTQWMVDVSPFGWYLADDPMIEGLDLGGVASLAVVPVLAALAGWWAVDRRDLMT